MQPRSQRRVHGAEFKAQVLAECQQPGASVAAVALAHSLNVNLLRKWLVGRGIKRTGLAAPRMVTPKLTSADDTSSSASLQFIPVEIAPAAGMPPRAEPAHAQMPNTEVVHVELARGATRLSVRWPSTQVAACVAWLRELTVVALKD